jgi:formylglycine-generating enzyme required for sulfatase activity
MDSKAYILTDLPTEKDSLDFAPYVNTLVDVITSPNTSTPLTIGIFGTWGSGKTSLMSMIEKGLPKSFRTTWFNAWMYDKQDTLWRVLLLHVLTALKEAIPENKPADIERLNDLEAALYQSVEREKIGELTIDWGKFGRGVTGGAMQIGLAFLPGGAVVTDLLKELRNKDKADEALSNIFTAIHRERARIHIDQIKFLEQFHRYFSELAEEHLVKKNLRLVVFIDDLDRCLPDKAVEVLEAIKLFLDTPGCVFVLGLDQNVITRGIELKYRELGNGTRPEVQDEAGSHSLINGERYLEKIIQLPFRIPPIDKSVMNSYVKSLLGEWPHPACHQVFAEGLSDNPRQIKRTVNMFLLLWSLARQRSGKLQNAIKPIRLAKLVAIQTVYPELYELLRETPRYLRELEEYYMSEFSQPENRLALAGKERSNLPPALAVYTARDAVRRILTLHPTTMPDATFSDMKPNDIRLYFTLTRRTETSLPASVNAPRLFFEPQMVHIPVGSFIMGSSESQIKQFTELGMDPERLKREFPQHLVELSDYYIGKYPVTNREYQAFIMDTGYQPPAGWDEFRYPEDKGDHPVVNVAWEASENYCKWLSEKTGKEYRLPTEAEWEKAARGTDGRIYPWGNKFDSQRCNTIEAKIGDTTPVGQYSPRGDSPFGVADISGNIWEWCADWFNEKEYEQRSGTVVRDPRGPEEGEHRVLRGGSFILGQGEARCAARFRLKPYYWFDFGFRVVMPMPPTETD